MEHAYIHHAWVPILWLSIRSKIVRRAALELAQLQPGTTTNNFIAGLIPDMDSFNVYCAHGFQFNTMFLIKELFSNVHVPYANGRCLQRSAMLPVRNILLRARHVSGRNSRQAVNNKVAFMRPVLLSWIYTDDIFLRHHDDRHTFSGTLAQNWPTISCPLYTTKEGHRSHRFHPNRYEAGFHWGNSPSSTATNGSIFTGRCRIPCKEREQSHWAMPHIVRYLCMREI